MLRPEQERVKQLLTEAVTLLCRNSLQFEEEVSVEGLLGITLDRSDIFLVSIRETVRNSLKEAAESVRAEKHKDRENAGSPTSAKRRRLMEKRRDEESPAASPLPEQKTRLDGSDNGHERLKAPEETSGVKVKQERNSETNASGNASDWQGGDNEDGRKFNPAFDSTASQSASEHSGDPPRRSLDFGKSPSAAKPSTSSTTADHSADDSTDLANVKIKEEANDEEDECFLIESDSENSDASRSSHFPQDNSMLGAHSWANQSGDNSFNLQELDLIAAQQFSQQFGNLTQGNNTQFMQQSGQGMAGPSPSTSQAADGSQRMAETEHAVSMATVDGKQCGVCGKRFSAPWNLRRHIRVVHMKMKLYTCPICSKQFPEKRNMHQHVAARHHQEAHCNP